MHIQGWGTTVMLGIHTSPKMMPLHPMELFSGRKVVASIFGGFKGRTQLPHFAKQCTQGVSTRNSILDRVLIIFLNFYRDNIGRRKTNVILLVDKA